MDDFILTVSEAYQDHSSYAVNKTRGLNVRCYKHMIADDQIMAQSIEGKRIFLFDIFAALFNPSINHITNFALRIPGFRDLAQGDQMLSIKLGVFEVWLVHAARLIDHLKGTIIFSDGTFLSRQQMTIMFGNEFATMLFNFVDWFNSLQLNDSEIALYSAAVLLRGGKWGIQDDKAIEQIHKQLAEALKYQIPKRHFDAPRIVLPLLFKLHEIRMLGEKYLEQLEWFKTNWTHLKLPDFFAEIFDFPKANVDIALRSKM